ncbi:MAG: hypothetical protein R3C10_18895 [Pirellulales bacterium]
MQDKHNTCSNCEFYPVRFLRTLVLTVSVSVTSTISWADPATFLIDESRSYLRIVEGTFDLDTGQINGGTFFANSFAVVEQASGSLVTTIGGSISADVTGATLTFAGGSEIDARPNPSGPFTPSAASTGSGGLEDNYGGVGMFFGGSPEDFFGELAIRDAASDIIGGSVEIGIAPADVLESEAQLFAIVQGVLDYLVPFIPTGYVNLPTQLVPVRNSSSKPVTGDVNGTIQIPFELSYDLYVLAETPPPDSRLVLSGLIVATRVLDDCPVGDGNCDGWVDGLDYLIWAENFGTHPGPDGDFGDGDFNDDGSVNGIDYLAWAENFGTHNAASVPEPATSIMGLMAGSLPLLVKRRRSFVSH